MDGAGDVSGMCGALPPYRQTPIITVWRLLPFHLDYGA